MDVVCSTVEAEMRNSKKLLADAAGFFAGLKVSLFTFISLVEAAKSHRRGLIGDRRGKAA